MHLISLYRNAFLARNIVNLINSLIDELKHWNEFPIKIMNFCGTHEHTITYYGIRSLIPDSIDLIPGPGCPVCIVPASYIDAAIELALDGIEVYTYGDMYRVPGSQISLAKARAEGASVKVVYSFLDAIKLAKERKRESVFFAVGFETTQPTIAVRILKNAIPSNLRLLIALRLTPPVMRYILEIRKVALNGIIAPGHVSTIIGAKAWSFLPTEYNIPTVVAGFEPLDVLISIAEILRQIRQKAPSLYNEYKRVVTWEGNLTAQRAMKQTFEVVDGEWRGIGLVPLSSLRLKEKFRNLDAIEEYGLKLKRGHDIRTGCKCADVLLGNIKPTNCPMFLKICTPSHPLGPCMVSSEGACHIWAKYGSGKELQKLINYKK